ncbi:30S ribosomal protein S18 [Candidatus Kaiserbacteria bacterium]|nr:30S ribosomal protein S18 [Candidatus Kaiserbacteria bacterium]
MQSKKKPDFFSTHNVKHIDYRDTEILKQFLNPHGRMLSRKKSGLNAKHQRLMEVAVKRARFMGLLPFVSK